mgnify:CR=1 FL=1
MSEIKVDTVGPRVDNGTLTIGAAGDTVNIAGTAGTGFPAGTTINTNADNRVITGSGTADTLNGEANLNFDGSQLTIPTGSAGAPSLAHAGDTDTGIYFATNQINFATAGNNRVELLPDGNLSMRQESLKFETAGKGVYLGTTTGAAANLLNDYEFGDFTPTWTAVGSGSITGTPTNFAKYVKSGRQVTVSVSTIFQTSGTFTDYRIDNLPFTQSMIGAGCGVEYGQQGVGLMVQGVNNSTQFLVKRYDAAFIANAYIMVNYTYITTA